MRISLIIVGLGAKTVTKADHSKRIDEELVCVDSLAHDLRQRCGCREIQVQREENDPPDFWVDVDGQRYAAEVTSITTRQAYQATCRALKEAVGNAARNQGCLNGIYALLMRRKPDLPRRAAPLRTGVRLLPKRCRLCKGPHRKNLPKSLFYSPTDKDVSASGKWVLPALPLAC